MKLRNKKTGEIFNWNDSIIPYGLGLPHPKSLADINERWEDYEPKKPRIEDEKTRKCVKLWLEINEIYSVTYHKRRGGGSYLELDNMPMRNGCCIIFQDLIEELEDEQVYTFEELCGEGEE